MSTAKLSRKAQVVIPAHIRRKLGLHPGDRLEIEAQGDHVIIRKAPDSATEALKAFRSEVWKGQAEALRRERDNWEA